MTEIEKQIVLLKADGSTLKEIADCIGLNVSAVHKRIKRLIKKHNCKSFAGLCMHLSKNGHI